MGETRECRSCGAEIIWAVTTKGKRMPVDAIATDDGNLMLSIVPPDGPLTAKTWAPSLFEDGEPMRYTSHFVTCKQAQQWRKA